MVPSEAAISSRIARNDPCHCSRSRGRHARSRYHSRHPAGSDGLGGRHRRVLHDLLAPRRAESPIGARVVGIFCEEKLRFFFSYQRRPTGRGGFKGLPALLQSLP